MPHKLSPKTHKKFNVIARIFIVFIAILLPISQTFAKIDNETLKFYAKNNILYYDSTNFSHINCSSYAGGSGTVYGGDIEEKIWVGLRTIVGLSEEKAAAAMGNMKYESSLSPAMHEQSQKNKWQPGFTLGERHYNPSTGKEISYGLGLIQWSFQRRANMYNYVKSKDASLVQYFDDYNTYSPNYSYDGAKFLEVAGETATNALIQYELEFLRDEFKDGSLSNRFGRMSDFLSVEDDVEKASNKFLELVENPADIGSQYNIRYQSSLNFYNKFHGKDITGGATTTESEPSASTDTDGSTVTIIGDSITNGAKSYNKITALLPNAEIDAADGRQWVKGVELLDSMSLRDNIVFALGTNNFSPLLTQNDIDTVISKVGNRNLFFVTNYNSDKPTRYDSNNTLFKQAASTHSNVYVIDWKTSVSTDPTKYIDQTDTYFVHPSYPAGYDLWSTLVANAVQGSSTISSSNPCGNVSVNASTFQEYVLKFAWPEYHSAPYLTAMPDYASTVSKWQSTGKYVGGFNGADCGAFVTILLVESGFEPDYNYGGKVSAGAAGVTSGQYPWISSHWTLLNKDENSLLDDASILQPGDVALVKSGPSSFSHTFIYVGNIDGFDSDIASASFGERMPMAGTEGKIKSSGKTVLWYRKGV